MPPPGVPDPHAGRCPQQCFHSHQSGAGLQRLGTGMELAAHHGQQRVQAAAPGKFVGQGCGIRETGPDQHHAKPDPEQPEPLQQRRPGIGAAGPPARPPAGTCRRRAAAFPGPPGPCRRAVPATQSPPGACSGHSAPGARPPGPPPMPASAGCGPGDTAPRYPRQKAGNRSVLRRSRPPGTGRPRR